MLGWQRRAHIEKVMQCSQNESTDDKDYHQIEKNLLICLVSYLTGFYLITPFVVT